MLKKFALPELNNIRHLLIPSAVIFIALVFIMPHTGHSWDTACWGMWATRMQGGLVEAYSAYSPVNYLPLYLYVLKIYSMIFPPEEIYGHIYLLKTFTLLFDIAGIVLLCSMIRPSSKRYRYFLFGLFNIGYFYNTLIWNQVDAILAFFIFASFYFAFKQRLVLSVFLFILSINFKLQGIIFLPVIGLMWLPHLKPGVILKLLLMFVFTEAVIILPYLINGNAKNILRVLTSSVDYFQYISMNAFNLWHLLCEGDLMKAPDNVQFIGALSYKHVGLILFLVFSALVCVPLYIQTIVKMIRKQGVKPDLKAMLLASSLIVCFFFYFNTQMHERYIHPLIIFSTALAFLYKHWGQWVIFSVAYALSLESMCKYLQLTESDYKNLVFRPDFIACLFGIGILQLMHIWYKTKPFNFKKGT